MKWNHIYYIITWQYINNNIDDNNNVLSSLILLADKMRALYELGFFYRVNDPKIHNNVLV